jgi:hypothetical protein
MKNKTDTKIKILAVCLIAVFISANYKGYAQYNIDECVTELNLAAGGGSGEGADGISTSKCKGTFSCSGTCSGNQPPVGTYCTVCKSAGYAIMETCTDGTTAQKATPVTAPCTGIGCSGCGTWTAVPGGAPTTIYCGATGSGC